MFDILVTHLILRSFVNCSAEAEVLTGAPVVLLVVALLEDIAHRVLLISVVHHAHLVELHLPEK